MTKTPDQFDASRTWTYMEIVQVVEREIKAEKNRMARQNPWLGVLIVAIPVAGILALAWILTT